MEQHGNQAVLAPYAEQATASPREGKRTFLLVQVLRAVAALMVVWMHTTMMQNEHLDRALQPWLPGAAGVDLFFVISGFVMAISSRSLISTPHPMRTFLTRRIERVVPLYWLATTLKLILALAFPIAGAAVVKGVWHIISSYLFVPSFSPLGALQPVLIVGWTLNYEMFFYLLFAIGLGLRLRILPYLCLVLIGLGTIGIFRGPYAPAIFSLADPLLWEFLYGVLLAVMLPRLNARTGWQKMLCGLLVASSFAIMILRPLENTSGHRAIIWGLPAMLIVGSALAVEGSLGHRIPRWILEIGDASYSIYLTHTILLAGLATIAARYRVLDRAGYPLEALVCVVLCILVSEAVYRVVELPIVRFFQGHRQRALRAVS